MVHLSHFKMVAGDFSTTVSMMCPVGAGSQPRMGQGLAGVCQTAVSHPSLCQHMEQMSHSVILMASWDPHVI